MVAEIRKNYYELIALDKRLETLDLTISLQEQSLQTSRFLMDAGRGDVLADVRVVGHRLPRVDSERRWKPG